MLLFEELNLERQDGEELVHIALDILDAILLPSPYLGRDVIIDRTDTIGLYILGYLQVKARIVDEDDYIRLPLADVLFTHLHITKNGAQVQQHRNETHISQFAIMLHTSAPNSSHQVAPKEAELRLRVLLL